MSDQRYSHSISPRAFSELLLYQANQFELFKNFVIEILDSRKVIERGEFQELFDEYKKMNKSKFLHNLIVMHPTLDDLKIDVPILHRT
ncbi:MAG: hypothetical protein ABIL68_11180 [bacterium]